MTTDVLTASTLEAERANLADASVEAFAQEFKELADETQVLKSETCGAEGQTFSLFQDATIAADGGQEMDQMITDAFGLARTELSQRSLQET